ncbi:MAG: right-handed parallel beta-helix repeat-containing protein [Anaerolineaceae bacterium]|nr:right-handed parallel beta-helix repeat-containing protein [Anaerolineaceae bacterium]
MKPGKLILPMLVLLTILIVFSGVTSDARAQSLDIFVANTKAQCGNIPQCYFNDDPDTPQSVALNKAMTFVRNNPGPIYRIHILSAYNIKTSTVIIDRPVELIGEDSGWLSTSSGTCTDPLLRITSAVTIRNLYITDGSCNSPSRNLVVVDSSENVLIENSTFEYGNNAIVQINNLGDLIVRFSEIKNNDGYALLSENTEITSRLQMTANNVFNNGNQPQVICQGNNSEVNHNYWGVGISATQATQGCGADNVRMLGAQIVSSPSGVQAALQSIGSTYPAADFFGFSARSDANTQLYVVNHGTAMPFPDRALGGLTACGNYFDIFLAEGSQPANLTLRFSYSASTTCVQAIQTISLCGSGSMTTFPLMWQDVKTGVTAGWDNTGDSPKGTGGNFFPGQETRCNLQAKNIEVVIDNDGRPNLDNDLAFTPFVVGFDITAVTVLRPVEQTNATARVNWTTSSEINTSAFKVMRGLAETGPWVQIGSAIPSLGGSLAGRTYFLDDTQVAASTTYYYLLQVIGDDGSVQQSVGPVRLITSGPTNTPRPTSTTRPTSTRVPTRTPTPFRTATNSFRTSTPTRITTTAEPSEVVLITATPTLEPFQKPTNLQSTETKRPTVNPAELLDKGKDKPANPRVILFVSGTAIVVLIVVLYFYLSRKSR